MSIPSHPLPAHGEPAKPEDAVEVGRILGAWGVQGGLKVKPFSSDPQALFSSKRWFIEPSDAKPGHVVPPLLRVVRAREQNDAVVATVQEVTDRDTAQALAGYLERHPELDPGSGGLRRFLTTGRPGAQHLLVESFWEGPLAFEPA